MLPIQSELSQNIDRYTLAKVARTVGDVVVINAPMVTVIIFGLLDRENGLLEHNRSLDQHGLAIFRLFFECQYHSVRKL